MLRLCLVAALACLTSPTFGQVSAKIVGPEKVESCEIVELKTVVEGDDGDFWIDPQPAKIRERFNSDGQKCYLFLPCDGVTYRAHLMVVGAVDGKFKIARAQHTVKVEGAPEPEPEPEPTPVPPKPPGPNPNPPTPTPPTPPGPNPPPNPEPEDGRFVVAKLAYSAGKGVNRPAECAALAGAFREAAKVTREKDLGVLSILSRLRTETGKAIPDSSESYWESANSVLSSKLKSLYSGGQLGSSKDWADCFEEVALGLEAASK